jgi:hypothetical protein
LLPAYRSHQTPPLFLPHTPSSIVANRNSISTASTSNPISTPCDSHLSPNEPTINSPCILNPTSATPRSVPSNFLRDSASTPSPTTSKRARPQPQSGPLDIASSAAKELALVIIVLLLGQSRVLFNGGKLPRFEVASRSAAMIHGATAASLLLQGLSQTPSCFLAAVLPASKLLPPSRVTVFPLTMTKLPDTITGFSWSTNNFRPKKIYPRLALSPQRVHSCRYY